MPDEYPECDECGTGGGGLCPGCKQDVMETMDGESGGERDDV